MKIILAAVFGALLLGAAGHSFAQSSSSSSVEAGRSFLVDRMPVGVLSLLEISEKEYDNLYRVWPEELREKAKRADLATRRQMALERYGFLPADSGRVDDLPLGFNRLAKGQWRGNCLFCHAGTVPERDATTGEVRERPHLGSPNRQIDLATFWDDRYVFGQKFTLIAATSRHRAVYGTLYRNFQKEHPLLPKVPRGTSIPWAGVAAYLSLRTIDADHDLKSLLSSFVHGNETYGAVDHPIDTPAWWTTAVKTRLYQDGFAPFHHRTPMISIAAPGNEVKGYEKDFRDLEAWIRSLKPPKYPWPIDSARAARGRKVFASTCFRCHGGEDDSGQYVYPSKRVDVDIVGTDPLRLENGITPRMREVMAKSWFGDYGKLDYEIDPEGYMAPPLLGVWASPPYLHNGSVPTLRDLVFFEGRPTVWTLERGYDSSRIGAKFLALTAAQAKEPSTKEIYDTRLPGQSAQGHTFTKSLSSDDREDLLEYLKTL